MNKTLYPGLKKQPAINKRDKSDTVSRQVRVTTDVFNWATKCQQTFPRGEKPSRHDIYVWLMEQACSRQDVVIGEADFSISEIGTQSTVYATRDVHASAIKVVSLSSAGAPVGGVEAVYIAMMRSAIRAIEHELHHSVEA